MPGEFLKCQKKSLGKKSRNLNGSRAGAEAGDREVEETGRQIRSGIRRECWGLEVTRDPPHLTRTEAPEGTEEQVILCHRYLGFSVTISFELHGHPDKQVQQTRLSAHR